MAKGEVSAAEQAELKKKLKKKLQKSLGRKPTKEEVAAAVVQHSKKRDKGSVAAAVGEQEPSADEAEAESTGKKKGKKEKSKKEKKEKKKKTKVVVADEADEGDAAAAAPAMEAKVKKSKGKKRKLDEVAEGETAEDSDEGDEASASAVASKIVLGEETQNKTPDGKRRRKVNEPFRRVKDEEIEVAPELADNSYEGTFGENGWGAKASADLIVTKGKSFRHEKNKKKRGSYRGGQIDIHAVNSVKKTFDDWPE
eukprot:m.412853 g.412853  ORF g.412853 m.412853 type:complete len:254 (+) comp28957_c0_seq1:71-832(+)